jgi:predicted TIM-barrel fold metal-dependent hydrolase
VWGTDWPHPDVAVVPEDKDLLDALFECVPDEAVRHRILVENPAKLYRF